MTNKKTSAICRGFKSDRRGSNPRSRPWQGRALPTTPLSHKRVMGIEPTCPAWKAGVLPLNYTRAFAVWDFMSFTTNDSILKIVFFVNNFFNFYSGRISSYKKDCRTTQCGSPMFNPDHPQSFRTDSEQGFVSFPKVHHLHSHRSYRYHSQAVL